MLQFNNTIAHQRSSTNCCISLKLLTGMNSQSEQGITSSVRSERCTACQHINLTPGYVLASSFERRERLYLFSHLQFKRIELSSALVPVKRKSESSSHLKLLKLNLLCYKEELGALRYTILRGAGHIRSRCDRVAKFMVKMVVQTSEPSIL